MSNLPERYQPYATPAGQTTPNRHLPAAQPVSGPVELYGEREPVVYVPSAEHPGLMVPVLKQYVQPMHVMQPRDLTPQPLLDPMAQRMIGAGVGGGAFAAGVGYGVGQILGSLAGLSSGAVFWLAVLYLATKLPAAGRAARGDTYVTNNHNRGFSRSTTKNH